VLALVPVLCAACGSTGAHHAATKPAPVSIDPASFVAHVDNPWFPLRPGTRYVYRGVKDGQPTRDVFTVTGETKVIEGVHCVVVHDSLYERGKLEERTTDWYTQDKQGNVWYFGESTEELNAKGKVTSTAGTWQAGVHGAQPGIYLPGNPSVGQSGRQEFFKGQAEDHFRVVSLAASVTAPYTASKKALLTEEWTPLEPGVLDHKFYLRGVGTVKEVTVKGPKELNALVSVSR